MAPAVGTADAEIKVPAVEKLSCHWFSFKAWRRSEYSSVRVSPTARNFAQFNFCLSSSFNFTLFQLSLHLFPFLTRSFIYSLAHSDAHSLADSLTHSLTRALIYSLTHSVTQTLTASFTQTPSHSFSRSLTGSLTYSLSTTHSRTHQHPTIYILLQDVKCDVFNISFDG